MKPSSRRTPVITFVTGTKTQERTLDWPAGDLEDVIDKFIAEDARSQAKKTMRIVRPDYIIFPWEGEWHLIDRRTRQRRYLPNKEAAEMLAIHGA